jgi:hypothetical protein
VARLFSPEGGPLLLAYKDTRALAEMFYPLLQIAARMGTAQLARARVDLDLDGSLLPSTAAISGHLQPSVAAVYVTERGFEIVTHQTLPGSAVGVSAPLSVGLLVPATLNAQRAARRAQASNNLKQIGLSLHNYHDAFKAFPAAYSVDASGKPLLSWRVHVLPLLEQYDLYQQFHLDEPWDSEHNKQLIPRMPAVFRSPNSKAEPGKTVYVGIRHEDGLLAPPAESQKGQSGPPKGTRFFQVTDGLSKTLLAVEASDESAVIWTKPDDLVPDKDGPLKGIIGLRPGGFNALFGDGYVRFISANADRAALRAAMTKSGGEVDDIP